jgi:hypothetical protein
MVRLPLPYRRYRFYVTFSGDKLVNHMIIQRFPYTHGNLQKIAPEF